MSRGVSGKLSKTKTERLLRLLAEEVPAFRRSAEIPVDTCILHAHLAIEMVRVAGGRARPFPVKVRAASPEMARRLEAGESVPDDDDAERIEEWRAAGAVGCAIGYGSVDAAGNLTAVAEGRYDGHLVALVAERYILDLTADQIGHREGLITIDPFWAEVPREFVRGESAVILRAPDGSVASYIPNLGCKDYLLPRDEESTWRAEPETARQLLRTIGWRG